MTVQRLASTDGFVVLDLGDGVPAAGIVRLAPKVLVDGATWLARSVTYRFAVFEQQRGGASAGINARDDVEAALAAAVDELSPRVADGSLVLDAGKGVPPAAVEAWRGVDPRPAVARDAADVLLARSVAASAAWAGDLEGRTVAIEGFDGNGPALVAELERRGARVVTVAGAQGAATRPEGFSAVEVAAAWGEHGPGFAAVLTADPGPAWAALAAEVDLLLAGSKAGVIDHTNAGRVAAATIVPTGPVPLTAKALAVLRAAGRTVLPDFVSTAGPSLAAWPPAGHTVPGDLDAAVAVVDAAVAAVLDDVASAADGPLLGACARAEAFLRTWQETLPFGRPLA
ncbi:MAG: hypothetical protein U0Q07_10175 [Acidimicrobiales bacterium]